MQKHRFIMWMLANGSLRTKDRMEYEPNRVCELCRHHDESNQHLFFECHLTCGLWYKVKQWLDIGQNFHSFEELQQVLGQNYKGGGRKVKAR